MKLIFKSKIVRNHDLVPDWMLVPFMTWLELREVKECELHEDLCSSMVSLSITISGRTHKAVEPSWEKALKTLKEHIGTSLK